MTRSGLDPWTIFFYIGSVLVVVFMAWRGWRLGIVRQTLNIVATAAAYLTGFVGGKYLIPVLRWLHFPDRILMVIGGAILAIAVFVAISLLSALLFKRTSQQSVGIIRFGYGASGALLGGVFGVFLVLVLAVAIRLLGSIAESELANASARLPASRLSSSLAHIKQSIESGATGAVMEKVDPVPDKLYSTLGKVGLIASSAEGLERFTENPGIRPLQNHPKIIALRDDPEIAKAVREQDFMGLLRHPKLVAAANDPEILRMLSGVNIERALNDAADAAEAAGPEDSRGAGGR
jgi:hypothetical protein